MSVIADKFMRSTWFWAGLAKTGNLAKNLGLSIDPPPLQTTKYNLSSEAWPGHYKSMKIAFASDFHVGCTSVSLDTVKQIVTRVNELEPDIILLPGDFLNSTYHGVDGIYIEPGKIADALKPLNAAYGVYATLGNHDVYEDPCGVIEALWGVGIKVLENQSLAIESDHSPFSLVAVGDSTTGNADCKAAFSDVASDVPVVAMCHNPYSIHGMPKGIVTAVAGHTHGPQYRIPLWKQPLLGCPDRGLNYGLQVRDEKPIVVTSGIGTSILPFRNTPPEIVELTISPKLEFD